MQLTSQLNNLLEPQPINQLSSQETIYSEVIMPTNRQLQPQPHHHLQGTICLTTLLKTLSRVYLFILLGTNPATTANTAGTGGTFGNNAAQSQQGVPNTTQQQGANQPVTGQQPALNQQVQPQSLKSVA